MQRLSNIFLYTSIHLIIWHHTFTFPVFCIFMILSYTRNHILKQSMQDFMCLYIETLLNWKTYLIKKNTSKRTNCDNLIICLYKYIKCSWRCFTFYTYVRISIQELKTENHIIRNKSTNKLPMSIESSAWYGKS